MNRIAHGVCVAVALTLTIAVAIQAAATDDMVRDRQVLVEFKRGVIELPEATTSAPLEDVSIAPEAVRSLLVSHGVEVVAKAFPDFDLADTLGVARRTGKVVRLSDLSRIYSLELQGPADPENLALLLGTLDEVVIAQAPNVSSARLDWREPPSDPYLYEQGGPYDDVFVGSANRDTPTNDPYLFRQWGLYDDEIPGYEGSIDAPEAWEITTGSANICVGILDAGFVMADPADDHEDLADRILEPRGLNDCGYDADPDSMEAHRAFFVAGTVGASTDNGIGVAGVDWNCRLMSKRVMDEDASEKYDTIVAAAEHCDILNCSWGDGYHWLLARAFANAYKLNCVTVASMGDEVASTERQYPAASGQGVIAVGKNTPGGWPAGNRYGNHIDVTAPAETYNCYEPMNSYGWMQGTSASTPYVSGIAALLLSVNPDLRNDDIEHIIRVTADDITHSPASVGWDSVTGMGVAKASRALEALLPPYEVCHWSASGASNYSNLGNYTYTFFDVPGIVNGTYCYVKLYDVRKNVTFPSSFVSVPNVWGRGTDMMEGGYSSANPNFGLGWCEVIDGSTTLTGCTLKTYVFDVYNVMGQHIGWFPCEPGQVTYAYTAHGCRNPGTGVADGDTGSTERPVLQLTSRNPSRGGATFAAVMPGAAGGTVRVFDVAGRLVRIVWQGRLARGERVFEWDGKDVDGRPVASGVYYARLETDLGAAGGKVVIMR